MKVKGLTEAISIVNPAVDAKGIVPKFASLNFNKTYVEATNGSLIIRANLDEECPEFSVNAEVFAALLKTVKDDDIEIKVEGKNILLSTKSIKTELASIETKGEASFNFNIEKWLPVTTDFVSALGLCRFTACTDQTAGPLTGVRVEGESVISCDRWRVSLATLKEKYENMTLSIELIDQLVKFSGRIKGYAVQGDTVYFDIGGENVDDARIGAKVLPGEYPTKQLVATLELLDDGIELVLDEQIKKNLAEASKRQNIIQTELLEFDRESRFTYKDGKITLYAQNESVGKIEESFECGKKKAEFSFSINPLFLTTLVGETDQLLYSCKNSVVCMVGASYMHLVKTRALKKL